MKLLVLGCFLVSAYSQSIESNGPSQYFERTPNSNLVQISYVGAQGASLYDNNQSSRSQRYGNRNQFNNQRSSQFSQEGNQAFNNQRFQNEFNSQNQRLNQQSQRFSQNSQSFNQGNQNAIQQSQVAQFSQQNRGVSRQYEPYSFNNYQFANPNLVEISFDQNRQQQFLQNQKTQRQQFQNRQGQRQNFQIQQSQSQQQLAQRQQQQSQLVQRQQQQAQLAQRQEQQRQQQAQFAQRQEQQRQQQAQLAQRQEQQRQQQAQLAQRQQQQAQLAQRQEQQRQQQAQFAQRQEQQRQQQAQLAQRQQQQAQLAQRQQQEFAQRQQQQQQFGLQQNRVIQVIPPQNQQSFTQQFQSQNQNRNPFINNNRGFQQSNFPSRTIPTRPQSQQSSLIVQGSRPQSPRPSRINQIQNQGIQTFQNQFQQGQGFQQSQMRVISGHLQRVDSDEIIGIFQPFSIPASASLYEGNINSQFSCDSAGQGFFAEPLSNGQQFHVCTRVQGINIPDLYRFTFQCVEGEYFDQNALTCVQGASPANGSPAAVASYQQRSQTGVNRALQLFGTYSPTPYAPGSTPPGLCYLANKAHFVTGIRRK